MAQFDLYRLKRRSGLLVVSVQSDLLDQLSTAVVIPLVPFKEALGEVTPRLKPTIAIGGESHVLMTADIGTIAIQELGKPVGSVSEHRDAIIAAVDFLISGF